MTSVTGHHYRRSLEEHVSRANSDITEEQDVRRLERHKMQRRGTESGATVGWGVVRNYGERGDWSCREGPCKGMVEIVGGRGRLGQELFRSVGEDKKYSKLLSLECVHHFLKTSLFTF